MGKTWKKTNKEELKTRYENRGKFGGDSDRKGYIDQSNLTMFVPEEGENRVRILPLHPDEKDTKHYGLDVHFHRNVGVDENYYLCLKRMKKGNCYICEHQKTLWNEEPEMAKELYPDQRCLVWIIDRNDDDKVKLWSAPKTAMDDIVGVSYKKKTGEILDISDSEEGYDVFFDRAGLGRNTKYKNYQLDDETNTVDDKLVNEIYPFTKVLIWPTYEEVKNTFIGTNTKISVNDENGSDENVETEKIRNLDEDVKETPKTNETDNPNCFSNFDGNSETCDDCDRRKNCRIETKNKTTKTEETGATKTSVKDRLNEALKKRKMGQNGQT